MPAPEGSPTVEDLRRHLRLEGTIQGLVIGDHNRVSQHYHIRPGDLPTPREAPPVPPAFTGREAQVRELVDLVTAPDGHPVAALCGMGGAGKSTIAAAVVASERVEAAFPDGSFWVDVRGGDPMDTLARIGRAYGVDVSGTEHLSSRVAAVRSLLVDKRVLLVVDDAWSAADARPFLPAQPASATLVTTRSSDVAHELTGAVIDVGPLDGPEGERLLHRHVGAGAEGHQGQLAVLADALGGLPLALELAGSRARKELRRPGFSWEAFTAQLARSGARLGLGGPDRGVRSAFEASWERALAPAGRERFALLGIFEPGDLLTGEVAAAWDASGDEDALTALHELIDLSLVQLLDPVSIRLHPLLFDFAAEKAGATLDAGARRRAHERVSDYHFDRAPRPPQDMAGIRPVLRSHRHAWDAGDRERMQRVFPWFEGIAVPGFLIDHGAIVTLVRHRELEVDAAREHGGSVEAWARYWLADALAHAGDVRRADEELAAVIGWLRTPDADDPFLRGRAFYLRGQVSAGLGDVEEAIAAFEETLALDRERGAGNPHELITLLQIGDLHESRGGPSGDAAAREVFEQVRRLARERGHHAQQVMALVRIGEGALREGDHDRARACLDEALALDPRRGIAGRQEVRYAVLLGRLAAELAWNGHRTLQQAVDTYVAAMDSAAAQQAWYEHSVALYWLGHLFEHLFLVEGREADPAAAWACYALATERTEGMELPPGINPAERLRTRILPRIDAEARAALSERVAADPAAVLREGLERLAAG